MIYRCDRSPNTSTKVSGGGVLIGVHKKYFSNEIHISNNNIECVFVQIRTNSSFIIIGAVYLPPNQAVQQYLDFSVLCEEILLQNKYQDLLLIGDFNLPQVDWSSNPLQSQDIGPQAIIDLANLFQLHQVSKVRNGRGVLLDLIFSNNEKTKVDRSTDVILPEEVHHPALDIMISSSLASNDNRSKSFGYDFKRCQLDQVFDWVQNLHYPMDLDQNNIENLFNSFCANLSSAIKYFTPLRFIGGCKFPRWYSPDLKTLTIRKKVLHKRYKESLDDHSYTMFKQTRAQCKQLARECYTNYINNVEASLECNIKFFWSHIKNTSKKPPIPSSMHLGENTADCAQDICDLFAEHFASVYKTPSSNPPEFNFNTTVLSTFCFKCEEVEEEMLGLDCNKGTGPDEIPPSVLKSCSSVLAPHFTLYFNALLKTGIFPSCLKSGYITPIYKSGDATDIKNYRPVVIQSTIAKVFEALVLKRLSFHVKSFLIDERQIHKRQI